MGKLLIFLIMISLQGIAADLGFQQFDNQFSLGYGLTQGLLKSGSGSDALFANNFTNLNIERLFELGIWGNLNAQFVNGYTEFSANNVGFTNSGPVGSNGYLGGVVFNLGYSFIILPDILQLIPYGELSRNTNVSYATLLGNNQANIYHDNYYGTGGGLRLEYKVNQSWQIHLDQSAAYNFDQSSGSDFYQSSAFKSTFTTSNTNITTLLGIKFNPYQSLQLKIDGFYNNYISGSSIPLSAYTTNNSLGGIFSIGYHY